MSKTKEQKAEQYAKEQNSCYTNDYYGFLAGYQQALKDIYQECSECGGGMSPKEDGRILECDNCGYTKCGHNSPSVNKGVKYPNCKSNN